jgi:hypothetical protein
MKHPLKLHPGERYARLVIIGYSHVDNRRARHYQVMCDCGIIKTVRGTDIRRGVTVSCGCLRREKSMIHGKTKTREFRIWAQMRRRCENPNDSSFPRYGGRGIRVCDRWSTFEPFLSDMGTCPPNYSIDRINNDGNYEPLNCRWANVLEQQNNRRDNHLIEFRGNRMTLAQWERELGVPPDVLKQRINKCGWSIEKALTHPVRIRKLKADSA